MKFSYRCKSGFPRPHKEHIELIEQFLPKVLNDYPRLTSGDFKGVLEFSMVSGMATIHEREETDADDFFNYSENGLDAHEFLKAIDKIDHSQQLPMLVCTSTWFDNPNRSHLENYWDKQYFSWSHVLVTIPT